MVNAQMDEAEVEVGGEKGKRQNLVDESKVQMCQHSTAQHRHKQQARAFISCCTSVVRLQLGWGWYFGG
jgi:hypothetical protein